jgi:hypothetical protein
MGLLSVFSTAPKLVEVNKSTELESKSGLVLVYATREHVNLTLPEAWYCKEPITIVAVDNALGITIKEPYESKILDKSNIQFNNTGDTLTFMSDRDSMWFCVSRYTSHLNY